jgi:hypothetical protein
MLTALPVGAQRKPAPAAPRVGNLVVQVIDSSTGRPMLRVSLFHVRVDAKTGARTVYHERADTTGQLALDSIPAGRVERFDVTCSINASQAKHLDSLIVRLVPGVTRRWTVRASSQGCDQRPFMVRRGVFTGFWATRGDVTSRFTPCDSLLPEAWAEFRPGALESPRAERPADLDETAPVFLRLEGTLIGPSYYGPEGREEYLISVERILDLRAPAQRYCEGSAKSPFS